GDATPARRSSGGAQGRGDVLHTRGPGARHGREHDWRIRCGCRAFRRRGVGRSLPRCGTLRRRHGGRRRWRHAHRARPTGRAGIAELRARCRPRGRDARLVAAREQRGRRRMSAMMAPPASRPTAARPLGVAAGPPTPASGSLHLAAEHFVASMVFLLAGTLGLVWIAPELAAGLYPSPHVAGITHLFTLGWITTTIFGALCQLLPVALGAPLRSERLGHASFWIFVPGVALFATGVATSRLALDHAGIALITIGILLVIANI